jgi:hypothetical protein
MADTFESVIASVRALTSQQIAATAIAKNAEIQASPPAPLRTVRHVDGVLGAPESAVKDGGVIVYDYGRLDVVAEFALDVLRQLSPVDSGDYVRSHRILLNGVTVGNPNNPASQSLASWKPGDRITISNPLPYTRKIEIGRKGYRAHAHVYEKAAQIVASRYGNVAKVFFTYDKAPKGEIYAWAWGKTSDQSKKHQDWLTRQPTLVIQENR